MFVRKRTPTRGEHGGHQTIPSPPVRARLRANTEGKSLCGVRPQADSYRRTRRPPNHSIAPCRSSLASEHGGEIVMGCSSASGLLQANIAAPKPLHCPRYALACERTRRENRYAVFVRKRTPTGEHRGHPTIPSPPVGARLRANAEGNSLCGVRPQADSYSKRTRRAPNDRDRFVRKRTPTASERGGHRTIATGSSASGLLQGANTARTATNQRSRQPG
jgi:hypothetical protein